MGAGEGVLQQICAVNWHVLIAGEPNRYFLTQSWKIARLATPSSLQDVICVRCHHREHKLVQPSSQEVSKTGA